MIMLLLLLISYCGTGAARSKRAASRTLFVCPLLGVMRRPRLLLLLPFIPRRRELSSSRGRKRERRPRSEMWSGQGQPRPRPSRESNGSDGAIHQLAASVDEWLKSPEIHLQSASPLSQPEAYVCHPPAPARGPTPAVTPEACGAAWLGSACRGSWLEKWRGEGLAVEAGVGPVLYAGEKYQITRGSPPL
ncbi:unnamed protein product [Lampetra fluviatilis]